MAIDGAELVLLRAATLPASFELVAVDVADDDRAIEVFMGIYGNKSQNTIRSYAKECHRFLLWARSQHPPSNTILPNLSVDDVNAYIRFLEMPSPFPAEFLAANGWKHQPFRKPLSAQSIGLALTVLHALYEAMHHMRSHGNLPYSIYNPVKLSHGANKPKNGIEEVEEALTEEEWEAVQEAIETLPREKARDLAHYHRARWIIHLLYRAFLRREEAASLRMNSFEPSPNGWSIRLTGKGDKPAKIVATSRLMEELKLYRESLGLPPLPTFSDSRPAILSVTGGVKGVTAQVIYLICKEIFKRAADLIKPRNEAAAVRLLMASPHWMRHTGISHGMEAGVDPRYVQAQARHSSLKVTARYDHKTARAWRASLEQADEKKD